MTWALSALGGTRTPNLLIRSQMLYPIELQAPATTWDGPARPEPGTAGHPTRALVAGISGRPGRAVRDRRWCRSARAQPGWRRSPGARRMRRPHAGAPRPRRHVGWPAEAACRP